MEVSPLADSGSGEIILRIKGINSRELGLIINFRARVMQKCVKV